MRISENHFYFLILIACVVLSIGGIFGCGYWWNVPADGGLGGAFAVAISLFVAFANRPYGLVAFRILTTEKNELLERIARARGDAVPENLDRLSSLELRAKELATVVNALVSRLNMDAAGQQKQNVYMAFSAFIGTVAWALGEKLANWIHHTF